MKKHFKKRLAAFKVGLVLSIMITPFCFYKLSDTVQAAGNVITYNSYGSTERGVVNVAYNGTTYMTDSFIRFNFNGNYNGVLGINLSGASPMSALAVVPDNCHIISTATNYIQIEFYGVNQCEVHFTGWQAVVGNFDIQSVIWNSMTKVSDSDSAQLVNIVNRLTTLNGYNDQIETLLSTNNQLLNTIANNSGSGGTSYVNEINVNVDHIADDLNLLKESNDSILDELIGFFTDGLGHILTIENVVNAIEDTTTALLGVQNQLTSISNTLSSINTTLSNIDQNITNIDNTIDTITFTDHTTYHWQHCNSIGDTLSDITNDANYGTNEFYYLPNSIFNVQYVELLHIRIPFWIGENNTDVKMELYSSGGFKINDVQYYLSFKNYRYVDIYLNGSGIGAANYYIKLIANQNIRGVSYREFNNFYEKINSNDIEYWTLLQFINQYSYNKKILEALQNLSINVNGDIVQQTETVINNYDSDFNTIHNIETNFTNNFDTVNPSVNSLLNQNLQLPNGFLEGSSFVKVLFPKIVDNSSLVGFPYFLILAIVVLIVLLG